MASKNPSEVQKAVMNKGNRKHDSKSKQTMAVYRKIMMSILVV